MDETLMNEMNYSKKKKTFWNEGALLVSMHVQ